MAFYGLYRGTLTAAADPTTKGWLQLSVPDVTGMQSTRAA
jgi:hypothetical protein